MFSTNFSHILVTVWIYTINPKMTEQNYLQKAALDLLYLAFAPERNRKRGFELVWQNCNKL
jgi:hypothetical protein